MSTSEYEIGQSINEQLKAMLESALAREHEYKSMAEAALKREQAAVTKAREAHLLTKATCRRADRILTRYNKTLGHIKNPQIPQTQEVSNKVGDIGITIGRAFDRLVVKGLIKPLAKPAHLGTDNNKFCRYHQGSGHATDNCTVLQELIQEFAARGLVRDITKDADMGKSNISHSNKTKGNIFMEEKLNNEMAKARSVQILSSFGSKFEVKSSPTEVVDIDNWDCSFKGWLLTGLPCCHAIAVLEYLGRSPYDYCSRYFTIKSYNLTYQESINPVPNVERPLEGEMDEASILVTPPPTIRTPGRAKIRKVGPGRVGPADFLKRQLQCGKCKGLGHNKRSCKEEIVE